MNHTVTTATTLRWQDGEKLPDDLARTFREMFHLEIMQGYGLTETTPVANINQPHPPVVVSTNEPQLGNRP